VLDAESREKERLESNEGPGEEMMQSYVHRLAWQGR